MATNERGHTVPPATGEAPSRAGIFGAFPTINDIILCSSAADRTSKIAGLSYTPSATRPAIFWRADATAGKQIEIYDGSSVRVLDVRDTGWVNLTSVGSFSGGGAAGTPTPQVRIKEGELEARGRITFTAIAVGGGAIVFQFNTGWRPYGEFLAPGAYNVANRLFNYTVGTGGALNINVAAGSAGTVTALSLDNLRFSTEA
ncbi:hypothetical protein [Demequina gelatinilytica]|uniref:hypothetical protein n=1 Tax=Demequina gelatinilytica TaxID=1638980 RepID=UPI00078115CD|nr:hypothetical protein [Demequina gelatinilytica]